MQARYRRTWIIRTADELRGMSWLVVCRRRKAVLADWHLITWTICRKNSFNCTASRYPCAAAFGCLLALGPLTLRSSKVEPSTRRTCTGLPSSLKSCLARSGATLPHWAHPHGAAKLSRAACASASVDLQIDNVERPYKFITFDTFIQKTKKLYTDTRANRNHIKMM